MAKLRTGVGGAETSYPQYYEHKFKLDLMFMNHYAPNRCLYIKVAKLRTGVGGAHNIAVSNYSKSTSKSKSAKGDYSKKIKYFYAPNFEKVGSILLSACPFVRLSVCPSVQNNFKARVLKFHI